MNMDMLCEGICLPQEVLSPVMAFYSSAAFSGVKALAEALTVTDTSRAAYADLAQKLGKDHIAMLACNLHGALCAYDRYSTMGIPDSVYFDTMACFRRFLQETHRATGQWQFDRAFWTYRQLNMSLFRIGELEYEILPQEQAISLHIPSDACFTPERIDASLEEARQFFARYYPQCGAYKYVCESWLLSQPLRSLLKPESNILRFQKRFEILEEFPEDQEFYQWIFNASPNTPPVDLAENTSMQRSVKALLLRGGNVGAALGVLK